MKRTVALVAAAVLLTTGCSIPTSTQARRSDQAGQSSAPIQTMAASSQAGQANQRQYIVTIDGSKMGKDYEGKPVLIVDYTFTNNSEKATSFLVSVSAKAFQKGVELSRAIVTDGSLDAEAPIKEIQKGATLKLQEAYKLTDESDVEVTVKPLFGNQTLATTKVKVG